MLKNKLIDGIIKEPVGGAHNNPEEIFGTVKAEILKHLERLKKLPIDKLLDKRLAKFEKMGVTK
jgi:acetyl-CoA carboxylase carboxyl transferase subunit alpha